MRLEMEHVVSSHQLVSQLVLQSRAQHGQQSRQLQLLMERLHIASSLQQELVYFLSQRQKELILIQQPRQQLQVL